MPSDTKIKEFLSEYADALKSFDIPESDFPLYEQIYMSGGRVSLFTCDGRHVATIKVKGDPTSMSMPMGPATLAYAKMFCELANAYGKYLAANIP